MKAILIYFVIGSFIVMMHRAACLVSCDYPRVEKKRIGADLLTFVENAAILAWSIYLLVNFDK